MQISIQNSALELVQGDITLQNTEAIVNAANSSLCGGGGVDGAIHRAGGPQIMEECKKIGGCPAGQAVITSGGNLAAKFVIHTVGPIYSGSSQDAQLLASAYRESLKLADKHHLQSISFPSISTGAYGYPLEAAAKIAFSTIIEYLKTRTNIKIVRLVTFSQKDYEICQNILKSVKSL